MTFLVIQTKRKTDDEGYVQPHQCEDEALAQLVMIDLAARYGGEYEAKPSDDPDQKPWIDLGGMHLGTFEADERGPLGFWPHQVDSVLAKLKKHRDRGMRELVGHRYAKMGGFYTLVCVSEATLNAAIADIESRLTAIEAEADRQFDAHKKWMENRNGPSPG